MLYDVVVIGFRLNVPEPPEQALMRVFGVDSAVARRVLESFPCKIKHGVPLELAQRFEAALVDIGARVELVVTSELSRPSEAPSRVTFRPAPDQPPEPAVASEPSRLAPDRGTFDPRSAVSGQHPERGEPTTKRVEQDASLDALPSRPPIAASHAGLQSRDLLLPRQDAFSALLPLPQHMAGRARAPSYDPTLVPISDSMSTPVLALDSDPRTSSMVTPDATPTADAGPAPPSGVEPKRGARAGKSVHERAAKGGTAPWPEPPQDAVAEVLLLRDASVLAVANSVAILAAMLVLSLVRRLPGFALLALVLALSWLILAALFYTCERTLARGTVGPVAGTEYPAVLRLMRRYEPWAQLHGFARLALYRLPLTKGGIVGVFVNEREATYFCVLLSGKHITCELLSAFERGARLTTTQARFVQPPRVLHYKQSFPELDLDELAARHGEALELLVTRKRLSPLAPLPPFAELKTATIQADHAALSAISGWPLWLVPWYVLLPFRHGGRPLQS